MSEHKPMSHSLTEAIPPTPESEPDKNFTPGLTPEEAREASQQKAGPNPEPFTRDEKLVQVGRAELTTGRMSPQFHEKLKD